LAAEQPRFKIPFCNTEHLLIEPVSFLKTPESNFQNRESKNEDIHIHSLKYITMASNPALSELVSPTDASPSSNPAAAPSATIVPTHFQHKTTSAAPTHNYLDTSQPSLNSQPIELDSTPLESPVTTSRQGSWKIPASGLGKQVIPGQKVTDKVVDPQRQKDPAVLSAPPETPAAEEFEAARIVEGLATPS
jgi:hypothetical protein